MIYISQCKHLIIIFRTLTRRYKAHAQEEVIERMEAGNKPSLDLIEQQLDELELLQSVFSQPGEFTTEESSLEHARAWVRRLTPDAPTTRLSCTLHLTVNRRPNLEEDVDSSDGEEGDRKSERGACGGDGEELGTVDISMILPQR